MKLCLSSPKLAFSTHKMPNFIVKIIFGFVIRIRYSDPFFNEYDTNTNRQKINELKRITIRIRHSAGSWPLSAVTSTLPLTGGKEESIAATRDEEEGPMATESKRGRSSSDWSWKRRPRIDRGWRGGPSRDCR